MVLNTEADHHLDEGLHRWLESVAGGRLRAATRVVGGQSREAWAVDVETSSGVVRLFLRREVGYGPMHGSVYTIEREAQVYRALEGTAVPVARVVGVHPHFHAVVLERIDGESYFPSVTDPDERQALAEQFAEILAALHHLDPARLDLPTMSWPRDAEEHATLELDIWEHLYRSRSAPDPLAAFGFRWLRHHAPTSVARTVLVQGDTGPGNFMFDGGRIVAVTDWELAHLGDPMEDLGWVATRSLLQPFVDLPAWFDAYEGRSGIPVDPEAVRYWTIFGVLRCVVGEGAIASSGEHNPERAMAIGLLSMHRSVLVDLLADASGVAVARPVVDTDSPPTPRSPLYAIVEETLHDAILPALGDPAAAHQARGALRVLRHLALADRIGPRVDGEACEDLAALLGHPLEGTAGGASRELAARIDAGQLDDPAALLAYFARETSRQSALTGAMMGRLAQVRAPKLTV